MRAAMNGGTGLLLDEWHLGVATTTVAYKRSFVEGLMAAIRFGLHLPHRDGTSDDWSVADMALAAESIGVDDLWVADHTVLVEGATSTYPFSRDGSFFTSASEPWFDWVVLLSYLAGVTTRARLGVSVAVLPHRHPVILGKQVATLDQLSGGRITLGVGAGWLAEEFVVLGVDFATRGRRMDAGLRLLREVWTGHPSPGVYGELSLPWGVRTQPVPVQPRVPILLGGDSKAALRRAAAYGDGWFGTAVDGVVDPGYVADVVQRLAAECHSTGRDQSQLTIAVRLAAPQREVGAPRFEAVLRRLVEAGVTSLSFDLNWRDPATAEGVIHELRSIVSALPP
jgi:probable F420-dependent oxidoreductase